METPERHISPCLHFLKTTHLYRKNITSVLELSDLCHITILFKEECTYSAIFNKSVTQLGHLGPGH